MFAQAEQAFSFPGLDQSDRRQELWKAIFDIAQNTTNEVVLADCFAAIRILRSGVFSLFFFKVLSMIS